MAVYVINPHPGLLKRGNIDLTKRPVVKNRDGSISTVRSRSFGTDMTIGKTLRRVEVLLPSVFNGSVHTNDTAVWRHFVQTKQHLGIFDSAAHADQYAKRLHVWQANYYLKKIKK